MHTLIPKILKLRVLKSCLNSQQGVWGNHPGRLIWGRREWLALMSVPLSTHSPFVPLLPLPLPVSPQHHPHHHWDCSDQNEMNELETYIVRVCIEPQLSYSTTSHVHTCTHTAKCIHTCVYTPVVYTLIDVSVTILIINYSRLANNVYYCIWDILIHVHVMKILKTRGNSLSGY